MPLYNVALMRNAVLFSLLLFFALACGAEPPSEEYPILLAHAGVWEDTVTDEATIRRLKELAGSSEPWIAQAARSALTIERYPRR